VKRHPYWTERRVVAYLRDCNAKFDGPGDALVVDARGVLMSDIEDARTPSIYSCYVPGDGIAFDAVAEARQLLAAWRDAQDLVAQKRTR
jgi:hypothetical protein